MIPRSPVPPRRRHLRCSGLFTLLTIGLALATGCRKVPLLAPTSSTITVTAPVSVLPVNGSTQVTAVVISSAGQAVHDGTTVTFTTTLGSFVPGSTAQTRNGSATVTFLAGAKSGEADIVAMSGSATSAGTSGATLKIEVGGAAASTINVTANPTSLPATGGTSTITATVLDGSGNLLPGVPVLFTTDAGTLSSSTVTTDSSGNARTTLTTNATAKVSATAGKVTTPVTVTVNVTAPINITLAQPSGIAPDGTATTSSPYGVGRALTFTASVSSSSTTPAIDHYTWNFGDGGTATTNGDTASHIYTGPSPASGFTITVTAVAVDGSTGTAQTVIQVE